MNRQDIIAVSGGPHVEGDGHRPPLSFFPKSLVNSGVRDGHCNRTSQKSLRFRWAKKREVAKLQSETEPLSSTELMTPRVLQSFCASPETT